MNTQSSKKNMWTIIAIIVVAAGAFYFYSTGSTAPEDAALLALDPEAQAVGSRVLGLLNEIQSLRIDTSIFSDPAYQTLQDYSVAIPEQNVGRPNPFAPVH